MDERFAAFANSKDGVIAIDANQRLTFWNEAMATLFRVPPEEAMGCQCWDLLQGVSPSGVPVCSPNCPYLRRARQGETVQALDLVLRDDGGRRLPVSVANISPGNERTAADPFYFVHVFRYTPEPDEKNGRLRIQLFGPARVWLPDGRAIPLSGQEKRKLRCLLAYLATKPHEYATYGELQAALWPEAPERRRIALLQATIAELRELLGETGQPRYLLANGAGCRLSDACWVDAAAFDRRIHRARLELDMARAILLYQEAIALYDGCYADDLEYLETWCVAERRRLHNLLLSAMEELGLLYEAAGLDQSALMTYYRILEINPEHRGACRHLFRLTGPPADPILALRTCNWLSRTVTAELNRLRQC